MAIFSTVVVVLPGHLSSLAGCTLLAPFKYELHFENFDVLGCFGHICSTGKLIERTLNRESN